MAAVTPPATRGGLASAASDFAWRSLVLFPLLVLVRIAELVMSHALPPGSSLLALRGLRDDLLFTLWVAGLLAIPVIAIGVRWPRAARLLHRLVLVVVAVIAMALGRYFAVTGVPLGADVFAYSFGDARSTVATSGGSVTLAALLLVVAAVAAWVATARSPRRTLPAPALIVLALLAGVAVLWRGPLALSPSHFETDVAFQVAADKSLYLVDQSLDHAAEVRAERELPPVTGYPLAHPDTTRDVLSPFLRTASARPDIVVIIVEGLGADFTGPTARYGGFTPFLDSLAARSLYWDNFHSIAGRTFGVLPAMLASLPSVPGGVMELGSRMPRHQSLVSLLAAQGYETSYFTGTDGRFDRIDAFMEHEGVGHFVDQGAFGAGYQLAPASPGGESWGYPDDALFRRSMQDAGTWGAAPRLDVYLTISSHEPFIPPRAAEYRARYDRILAAIPASDPRRRTVQAFPEVFSTLLYVDDAIAGFMRARAQLPGGDRTIYVITGDHRLVPVPFDTRASRYHVPLIVASPLVVAPHRFSAVSSHLDVTPTLLAHLATHYGIVRPDTVAWAGGGLDTAAAFRNVHRTPLMRTKGALDEYLDGTAFLSRGELFRLTPGFGLQPDDDDARRGAETIALARDRHVAEQVVQGDRLLPVTAADLAGRRDAAVEDSAFHALHLEGRTPEQVFAAARAELAAGHPASGRLVAQRLLRDAPSYHDARALVARAFAQQGDFTSARRVAADLARRAPGFEDGAVAAVDVELWASRNPAALALADSALQRFPRSAPLLLDRALAEERLGHRAAAMATLDRLRAIDPANERAAEIRRRLEAARGG